MMNSTMTPLFRVGLALLGEKGAWWNSAPGARNLSDRTIFQVPVTDQCGRSI